MTTAYILVNNDGIPRTRIYYSLYEGFNEIGVEIKFYKYEDFFNGKLDNITSDDMFVGSFQSTEKALKILGKSKPVFDCYPEEYKHLYKRQIYKTTLSQFEKSVFKDEYVPMFVKPVEHKLFDGFVCKSVKDLLKFKNPDDDIMLYVSNVVDIASEFRFYIHQHKILSCHRYTGSWDIAPKISESVLLSPFYQYHTPPKFYSLDIGILHGENYEHILVEANDGYALGNYGVPPRYYAEACMDRWNELVS